MVLYIRVHVTGYRRNSRFSKYLYINKTKTATVLNVNQLDNFGIPKSSIIYYF